MPSAALDAWEQNFAYGIGGSGSVLYRNVNASVAANQSSGYKLISEGTHVDQSVSTGSLVLPPVGSMEASGPYVIFNDTANSLNLYPGPGETINALGANAAIAIAAGTMAIAARAGSSLGSRGTGTGSGLNWRVMTGG
jgi:hypothetical protein